MTIEHNHPHIEIRLGSAKRPSRAQFRNLEAVFNLIPGLFFYVKDRSSRWVTCNLASLKLLRMTSYKEVIGAREEDFFPKMIADSIRQDDLSVIQKGVRIIDRVELIADEHHRFVWVKTSKLPITDENGEICGLVGITRIVDDASNLPSVYVRFRDVISHIEQNQAGRLRMSELARLAGMSESHFRRSFKRQFGVPPKEFILRQRLLSAAKCLTETDRSLLSVAFDCGFGDQSYFNRQFARHFGETPRQYRLRWRST